VTGLAQQGLGHLVDPAALVDRHRPDRVIGRLVLGGGVHERAPAVLVDHPVLGQRDCPGVQGTPGVARVRVDDRLHRRPRPRLALFQVGEDQVVLGREMPVEGHPGHPGLVDEPLYPDRLDAAGVEEAVRGRQDALPGRPGGLLAPPRDRVRPSPPGGRAHLSCRHDTSSTGQDLCSAAG
jgi:hypothetical protein